MIFLSYSVFAQFSTNTELKYLQIVNKQDNDDLIENNLLNAELVVDSLLLSNQTDVLNSEFLYELSRSYYNVKEYELGFFSILRQRCLFPNEAIQKQSETLFEELAYSNNLGDSLITVYKNRSNANQIPTSIQARYKLLLELACQCNTKETSPYIYKTGLIYRRLESSIPIWYQHWEFLTLINLKPKKINQALTYAKSKDEIYKQVNDDKLKYLIYRKAIKHYRRHKAYKTSNLLLQEYKNYKLGFFRRIDAKGKSIINSVKK